MLVSGLMYNLQRDALCVTRYLLGHSLVLHSFVSKLGPRAEHTDPPGAFVGLRHCLVLSCVPPPQVAVHFVQSLHDE